jgi:hypothetical protein
MFGEKWSRDDREKTIFLSSAMIECTPVNGPKCQSCVVVSSNTLETIPQILMMNVCNSQNHNCNTKQNIRQ